MQEVRRWAGPLRFVPPQGRHTSVRWELRLSRVKGGAGLRRSGEAAITGVRHRRGRRPCSSSPPPTIRSPASAVVVSVTTSDGIGAARRPVEAARSRPPGHRLHPAGPGRVHREVLRDRDRAAPARLCRRRLRLARAGPVRPTGRRIPARATCGAFRDYRRDLEAIRTRCSMPYMPEPHFALAHSMGGAIALPSRACGLAAVRAARRHGPMIALCIVKRRGGGRVYGAACCTALGLGGPSCRAAARPRSPRSRFAGNRLTSDPVRYARNADAATARRRRRHRRPDRRLARFGASASCAGSPIRASRSRSASRRSDRRGRRRSGLRDAGDRALRARASRPGTPSSSRAPATRS